MEDWPLWMLSDYLAEMTRAESSSEPWAWSSQRFPEVGVVMAAILLTILALVTYWANTSPCHGLEHCFGNSLKDRGHQPTQNQSQPRHPTGSDSHVTRRSSNARGNEQLFSRTKDRLRSGVSNSKTSKIPSDHKANKSIRHFKEDFCCHDSTISSTSPGVSDVAMQTSTRSLTPRADPGALRTSKQKTNRTEQRHKRNQTRMTDSTTGVDISTSYIHICNTKLTSFSLTSPENKVSDSSGFDFNSFHADSASMTPSSKTTRDRQVSLRRAENSSSYNSGALSTRQPCGKNKNASSKRKRALYECDKRHILNRATVIPPNVRRSFSRLGETYQIRHPRSKTTRHQCRSSNAHHHRKNPVPSFDLGACKKSFCVRNEKDACSQQPNIMFSRSRSPCEAVVELPPSKLLDCEERVTNNGTHSEKMLATDFNKQISTDVNDKNNIKISSHAMNDSDSTQYSLHRQKRKRCKDVNPTRYHAYFKPERAKKNHVSEGGESFVNNSEAKEGIKKWVKCHTVDKDNNLKCMISLSDGFNSDTSQTRYPASSPNSVAQCSPFSADTHRHPQTEDKQRRPKVNSPLRPGKNTKFQPNRVSPALSPERRNIKLKRKSRNFHPRQRNSLVASNKFHSEMSFCSLAASGDSANTLANVDILNAPVACPVHSSPRRDAVKTPPTLSLDSMQLVSLYKLAVKKVGVGFHISPLKPSLAGVPQNFLGDETGTCYHLEDGQERTRSGHYLCSPGKHQMSQPSRKSSKAASTLSGSKIEHNNFKKEMLTKHNPSSKRTSHLRPTTQTSELEKLSDAPWYDLSPKWKGHTGRGALVTKSQSPHNRKIDRARDTPSGLSLCAQSQSQNHRCGLSKCKFISSSPKEQNKGGQLIESDERKEKAKKQYLVQQAQKLRHKPKHRDKGNASKNCEMKMLANSKLNALQHLLESHEVISDLSRQKEKPNSIKKRLSPTRPKATKETAAALCQSPTTQKQKVEDFVLKRLADVVEKLTNALTMSTSPRKCRTRSVQLPKQNPNLEIKDKTNNDINCTPKKKRKRNVPTIPKVSPSVFSKKRRASKLEHSPSPTKFKTESFQTRAKQPKFLKTKITKSQHRNASPPQAKALTAAQESKTHSGRREWVNSSYGCVRSDGPPQLRTAARAAAKASVQEVNNSRPKETPDGNTRSPNTKRSKSAHKSKDQLLKTTTKPITNAEKTPNCDVGIQWPILRKKDLHPSNLSSSAKIERFPQNYHCVNLPDMFERLAAIGSFHNNDNHKRHTITNTGQQHTLRDRQATANLIQHTLCKRQARSNRLQHALCDRQSTANPIQHTLCDRQARSNRLQHTLCDRQARTNPIQHAMCDRQSRANPILCDRQARTNPIQHTLCHRQARTNPIWHTLCKKQARSKRLQHTQCDRQDKAKLTQHALNRDHSEASPNPFYHSSVQRASCSISVDTSWDVSASQVFDSRLG